MKHVLPSPARASLLRGLTFSIVALQVAACASQRVMTIAAAKDPFADYELRRAHSTAGHFLRGEPLHINPDASLASVLRIQIPAYGSQRDGRIAAAPVEACSVDVYVNGEWAPEADQDLRARDVEAVEYYQATAAPVRYRRSGRDCPILLVWLRRP